MLSPATTGSGKSLTVMAMSALFGAMMFVLAVATLFCVVASSVVVAAYAVLLRFVPAEPLAVRLRLNTADSFSASGVLRVQVIVPAITPAPQVHPALGVVIELKVLPAGICVVKLGVAALAGPLFVTVCVNVNAVPCTTTAGTVLVTTRSACVAEATSVVVEATLFEGVGSS
jgi:hypothetical protein